MSRFPGVGQRVRQRLRALGYWKDGRPDVGRFCSERDYRPQYLYAWLGDRIPTYDNLARLARDLEVPPEWVMFGTGSPTRRDALDAVHATRGPRRGAQIIDFARLRDVTSKLVRLEAELEAIFRAFPDLYVWLDTEGRVLAYEGGSGGSFDVSLELARGKKIADVFPSASGLRLEAALRQFLDAPSPVSTEFALGAKRYEARLLPLPVESGAQRQLLMIVRDITERKQAEEATTALARVGHELVGTLDLEEATARVVTAVLHHFRVDRACFFELDRTSGNLLCVATAGEHGDAQWTGRMIPAGASVAALAVQECRPVAARDVTTDPRVDLPAWLRERAAVEGHKSVVAVPLVSRGEVLGALSLASSTEREFSELELGLLTGFGATAALALENARRFHETEQGKALAQAAAAHSERRLRNLAQDLTAIVWEVDAATWRTIYVGHAAEKILGYPVERWYTEGDFWLSHLHPDDRVRFLTMRLEPVSREGHAVEYPMIAVARSNDEDEFDWNLPPGTGLVELAMRERRAVFSADVLADPRVGYTPEVRARIELGTVRAGLAVPLIARGTVIGALAVGARAGRVFDAREIRLAEAFADQAAVALAGARLHEEASHAHDFLRSVVANRADTVLTTDVHGRITYFSALAEKVCGWEAKELLGRHVSDFYKGGMDEARALMRRLRAETRVPGYRTTFRKKAGGWAEIDTCVALVRDARGAVVGTVGTAEGAAPYRRP